MRIAIDADGTIFGSKIEHNVGELLKGAKDALETLKSWGCYIIIWSCRNSLYDKNEEARNLYIYTLKTALDNHNLPYNEIDYGVYGKIPADVYIDDSAIEFNGDWPTVIEKIKSKLNG